MLARQLSKSYIIFFVPFPVSGPALRAEPRTHHQDAIAAVGLNVFAGSGVMKLWGCRIAEAVQVLIKQIKIWRDCGRHGNPCEGNWNLTFLATTNPQS
jgi:hypothetical protein